MMRGRLVNVSPNRVQHSVRNRIPDSAPFGPLTERLGLTTTGKCNEAKLSEAVGKQQISFWIGTAIPRAFATRSTSALSHIRLN